VPDRAAVTSPASHARLTRRPQPPSLLPTPGLSQLEFDAPRQAPGTRRPEAGCSHRMTATRRPAGAGSEVPGRDPLMKPLQLSARLDPKFLNQDAARPLIRGQRFSLAPGPVTGHHRPRVKPFPQRLRGGQLRTPHLPPSCPAACPHGDAPLHAIQADPSKRATAQAARQSLVDNRDRRPVSSKRPGRASRLSISGERCPAGTAGPRREDDQ
jgi:hypothetical protein